MPHYRVTANVVNCLVDTGAGRHRICCVATCEVHAADPGAAAEAGLRRVAESGEMRGKLLNALDDSPRVEVEHVDELREGGEAGVDLAWYAPDD